MSEQQSEYKIGDKVIIIDSSANSFNGSFGAVVDTQFFNGELYYMVASINSPGGVLGSYTARDLRRAPVTVAPADALFIKSADLYIAIDNISTIRRSPDGMAKINMGDQMVNITDKDRAARLLEWAERNAIDLGG